MTSQSGRLTPRTLGNIELGTVMTAVAGGQKQAIRLAIQYGQELI